ncbi:PREDICTED: calcium uniporter protein 4, mitochondrial-like [Populus euphratica]|uniref:Calcium uniporter protein 4, mitochondrial-like n=1 Tax=Populus euphratica TaxID=75702 RepID=A0AAJ6XFP9_POPEU|nr:PREDICTED: calcium uniporter protein 4, mitochondrial-like [Populus euphratica]
MAFRKLFSKRAVTNGYRVASPAVALDHSSPIKSLTTPQNNAASKTKLFKEFLTGDSVDIGFFRRFLHRRAVSQFPEFMSMPVGEKLREKLISGDRLHLDGLTRPEEIAGEANKFGISVENAKKILRFSLVEKLKAKLREIPRGSICYSEFVKICVDECGNEGQGVELAKLLDQSGNVIVLGNIVFLRPEQVAISMENMISQTIAAPDDPRRKHLEHMEKLKVIIDQKARTQVRGELYCGLGFIMIQTLGFMRLTFWELNWDVMEPICFFVTSLHFAIAYGFFLRTSTEPSFEGYFQQRFKAKQKKLMKIHGFDVQKYNQLRKVFYPNLGYGLPQSEHYEPGHH